jgi:hypothetical protein
MLWRGKVCRGMLTAIDNEKSEARIYVKFVGRYVVNVTSHV